MGYFFGVDIIAGLIMKLSDYTLYCLSGFIFIFSICGVLGFLSSGLSGWDNWTTKNKVVNVGVVSLLALNAPFSMCAMLSALDGDD